MVEFSETDRACTIEAQVRAFESQGAGETGSRMSLSAMLGASAAVLTACGGGGGGGGGGTGSGAADGAHANTAGKTGQPTLSHALAESSANAGSLAPLHDTHTASTYAYLTPRNDEEAARFLLQAQAWATDADIAAVRSQGYLPWLAMQLDAPKTQTGWDWVASKGYKTVTFDNMVWSQLMASPDGLRKRLALALSEIFVVSGAEMVTSWPEYLMAQYWDTLVAGVTGNFRTLLEDITLNPAMGHYLNTRGNQKENAQGRQPDENFARELMQLMSIGLHQLDAKGNVRLGSDGAPIDTCTQDDVMNLARVFTGYDVDIAAAERSAFTLPGQTTKIDSNGWTTRPMALNAAKHSMLAANFLGVTVPANTEGKVALKIALDALFHHPNVGPFIGRQLIQRLVTSNPGAEYVGRVAAVFADNGKGVRGDMKSVFAAVLMDNEARGPAGLTDPHYGRLREPMLRLVQWARTFGATSAKGHWHVGNTSDASARLGQSPLRSPSVFNFFRPGYTPASAAFASTGLAAPEFELVNEVSVSGYLNYMQSVLLNGIDAKDITASYAAEKALVLDPSALVARLNLVLCANQLSAATQALIVNALATPAVNAASTDATKLNRVYAAVLLVMASPEYLVQK
ncbi:DUF1800 family protein [Variovorax sp. J22R133]|uniref:DUF1800 domain-containing protein n=1 Tax=Variovorax brevis TaxID=3053503 RepID=UPI002578D54D|nr:DUF1800 family protein [Variovorax sp. J22R133]MDM0115375.1 DUF1800 family protein [Variovorax sp. J22R133]